ncbi:MAG: hypothetical protein ACK4GN_06795 [Runella sp.]
METTQNLNLSLTFQQVTEILRHLPKSEQLQLVKFLQKEVNKEPIQTHFASQSILAEEWLNQEEEQAWQHL